LEISFREKEHVLDALGNEPAHKTDSHSEHVLSGTQSVQLGLIQRLKRMCSGCCVESLGIRVLFWQIKFNLREWQVRLQENPIPEDDILAIKHSRAR
jgi:hypothetical protein